MSRLLNTHVTISVPSASAITADRLLQLAPHLSVEAAEKHARALDAVRGPAEINTPRRVRHFVAVCAFGSKGFRRLVEELTPMYPADLAAQHPRIRGVDHARDLIQAGAAAVANVVRAGRDGNGDPSSGDGWRFRARGYLRTQDREAYRQLARLVQLPLEDHPHHLEGASVAANAAAAWWTHHELNEAADLDWLYGIARLLDPSLASMEARMAVLNKTRSVWP